MLKIYNWNARRSGAAMTVTGEDEDGRQCIRTNVTLIKIIGACVIAIDNRDVETELIAVRPA